MRHKSQSKSARRWPRWLAIGVLSFFLLFYLYLTFRTHNWDGASRYTVVLATAGEASLDTQVLIFSLEPRRERGVLMKVPGDMLMEVPYGYKTYPLGSVYRLGELDGKRGGGMLLLRSVETTLSIPIDSYIVFRDTSNFLPQNIEDLSILRQKYFSLGWAVRNGIGFLKPQSMLDTNAAAGDLSRLWKEVRKLRKDQIDFIDVSTERMLHDTPYPDGTAVKTLDPDVYDTVIGDLFEDWVIRSEHLSLTVVNATNQQRIAAQFGNILEHMGANLIGKSTAKETQGEACGIYPSAPSMKNSAIVSRLVALYGCVLHDSAWQDQEASDIIVVLGEGHIR